MDSSERTSGREAAGWLEEGEEQIILQSVFFFAFRNKGWVNNWAWISSWKCLCMAGPDQSDLVPQQASFPGARNRRERLGTRLSLNKPYRSAAVVNGGGGGYLY